MAHRLRPFFVQRARAKCYHAPPLFAISQQSSAPSEPVGGASMSVALYPWHDHQHIDHQQSGALIVVQPALARLRVIPPQQFPDFLAPELYCKSMDMEESLQIC